MKNTKKLLLFIAILLIAISCFIIGGFVGFGKGTIYGLHASAPSDATIILTTINKIKCKKEQSAINLLESELNTKIIEHRLLMKQGTSLFNLYSYIGMDLGMNERSLSLMKKVTKYRMENPIQEKKSEVAAAIDEAVNFYLSNSVK